MTCRAKYLQRPQTCLLKCRPHIREVCHDVMSDDMSSAIQEVLFRFPGTSYASYQGDQYSNLVGTGAFFRGFSGTEILKINEVSFISGSDEEANFT